MGPRAAPRRSAPRQRFTSGHGAPGCVPAWLAQASGCGAPLEEDAAGPLDDTVTPLDPAPPVEVAALDDAAVELPWLSEEDAALAEDPCWAEEDTMEEDAVPEVTVAEVDPPMPDVAAEDVPDAREEGPPAEPAADDDPEDEEDDDRPTKPEEPPETAPEVELPVEASDSEVPLLWVHAVDNTERAAETTSHGKMRMKTSQGRQASSRFLERVGTRGGVAIDAVCPQTRSMRTHQAWPRRSPRGWTGGSGYF